MQESGRLHLWCVPGEVALPGKAWPSVLRKSSRRGLRGPTEDACDACAQQRSTALSLGSGNAPFCSTLLCSACYVRSGDARCAEPEAGAGVAAFHLAVQRCKLRQARYEVPVPRSLLPATRMSHARQQHEATRRSSLPMLSDSPTCSSCTTSTAHSVPYDRQAPSAPKSQDGTR